jgi:hypothetical protein
MLLVNPWRLALLFFISGVAVRFATDRARTVRGFAVDRFWRLGIPITAGVLILVMPQSYFELREAGVVEPGLLAFWPRYLSGGPGFPIITPTWNHLWYVVYLLVYILLLVPFLRPLSHSVTHSAAARAMTGALGSVPGLLLLVPLPFIANEVVLSPHFPETHALWGDWANHVRRLGMFLLGFLVAKNGAVFAAARRAVPVSLPLAVVLGAAWLAVDHDGGRWGALAGLLAPVTVTFYAWTVIVLLIGAGQRWLDRPSAVLRYLTGAVFCYYIVHQTIIVAAGFWLTRTGLSAPSEFALLVGVTVIGCAASYELVRRLPVLRLAFGVRAR